MFDASNIRRNGFFKSVIFNADALEEVCTEYMELCVAPNVAGLCAALGCTPLQIRRLFEAYETIDPADRVRLGTPQSPDPTVPPESSMHVLANIIMHIEAMTIEGGLVGTFNAHMSKFILSAFHERHEKQLHESKSDNVFTVHLQSHQPTTIEELREYERLEKAIAEEQRIELLAMGKLDEDEVAEGKNSQKSLLEEIEEENAAHQEERSTRLDEELLI